MAFGERNELDFRKPGLPCPMDRMDQRAPRSPTRLDRLAARARVGAPGRISPKMASFFRRRLGPLIQFYYRPMLIGWHRLPAERPYLLVANHSGGGVAEIGCLATLWLERFGEEKRLAGMAHPVI